MASDQIKTIAILSIRPNYAAAIISGAKRVEFRKKCFSSNIQYVVIYACSPVKKVLGFFKVSEITVGSPLDVWQQFRSIGGIAEESFQEYYHRHDNAVAISIEYVVALNKPISLDDLCITLSPPQSYAYLSNEIFSRIIQHPHEKKLMGDVLEEKTT